VFETASLHDRHIALAFRPHDRLAGMRLTEEAARERFASVPVMRLATADAAGRPHLVVATFAVDGDRIHTAVDAKPKRTRDLKRLRNIHANPSVAALADHYDDDWTRLWWVRADATATVVADPDAMAGPLALLRARYPQYRDRPPEGPVVTLTVERWTGWAYA
jgi:PPOX class probable F420-dependent enzyme